MLAMLVASTPDRNFGRRGRNGRNHNHRHNHRGGRRLSQRPRGGRQLDLPEPVQGGVDFTGCEMQDDGMCCVMREEEITEVVKDPVLECTHKSVEKCHYTYVTEFTPAQEEICEENFEKKCQITFKQMAVTETLKKCYRPLMKTCGNEATPTRLRFKRQADSHRRVKRQANLPGYGNGDGQGGRLAEGVPEQCKTFYETACTTKYVEKQPGKFVGDTSCEKLPVELCGEGCKVEEGEEECHDKEVDTLVDVPEEVCDLNPQKTCRFQTKLVPKLKPEHECTIIPQEICQLKFDSAREEVKPFMSKWCIDPNEEIVPDQTYDENSGDEPLGPESDDESQPAQLYEGPGGDEQSGYNPPESSADYEDYGDLLPPPDPSADETFEAAASTYEEPVYEETPAGQNYGGPAAQPNALYDAPPQDEYAAAPREGRTGRRLGGARRRPNTSRASRRNGRRGNKFGQKARRGRTGLQDPSTLYGAPIAEYGASDALPSYGASDALPSYGNKRSASNTVPVYVPGPLTGAPLISVPVPHRGGPLRALRHINNQQHV